MWATTIPNSLLLPSHRCQILGYYQQMFADVGLGGSSSGCHPGQAVAVVSRGPDTPAQPVSRAIGNVVVVQFSNLHQHLARPSDAQALIGRLIPDRRSHRMEAKTRENFSLLTNNVQYTEYIGESK